MSYPQFNLDVAEAIEEAYERCGMEVRTAYDSKTARRSLNLMLADWSNRGLNMWTVAQTSVSLVAGTSAYNIGADTVDIMEVLLRRDGVDYELTRISRTEYATIPTKTTQGRPSQFWFDRTTIPTINLWSVPDNSSDSLIYYYVRRIEAASAYGYTGDLDMPFRFLPAMVAGLAYYLALKKSPDRVQMLKSIYEEEFQRAADEDEDRVPLKLQPSISYLRV